jgi:predicted NAD/FAD-binding protein
MLVIIGLARADYEQLLHNVAPETPAFNVLRRCPELARWEREGPLFKCVIIECKPDEATLLLEAAKQHCPAAVPNIEYGFRLSRNFAVFS